MYGREIGAQMKTILDGRTGCGEIVHTLKFDETSHDSQFPFFFNSYIKLPIHFPLQRIYP